ncbi:hypothetical protein C2W62_52035 [Candidatus Entotheonella serta]|nr:hypothetical protein C2W62_52035 [Candidatus Entotheonella serta]
MGREAMDERLGLVVYSLDELRQKLNGFIAGHSLQSRHRSCPLYPSDAPDDLPRVDVIWPRTIRTKSKICHAALCPFIQSINFSREPNVIS